jgi:hypothetical protein
MRYIITTQGELQVLEVVGHNIFFGWDMSDDYIDFRNALEVKGIDAFVDLLIEDPNTAFLTFTDQSI